MENNKRSRSFTITDYELNKKFWEDLKQNDKISYLILGEETCPTTGRIHWQGWIHFENQRSLQAIKKLLKPRHIEIMNGSVTSNETYCRKENNIIYETGHLPSPGARSDLVGLADMIISGTDVKTIFETQPGNFIRYHKGIDRAIALYEPKRNWAMDVRIYWGPSGSGKTRTAHEQFANMYTKMVGKWWDHYNGEECVLIDDFDPENCFDVTFDFYLKLLDRYPLLVEVKGGSTSFRSKVIIFTSNFDPKTWFEGRRNRGAFFRRVTAIESFGK